MARTCFTRPTYDPSPDLSSAPPSPAPARPIPPAHRRPAGRLSAGPLPANSPPPAWLPPAGPLAYGKSSAPNVQWSAEQMDTLFTIARQKAKLELQAATAKTRHDEEKSLARIATIRAPTTPAGSTRTREDKEVPIGEISLIILSVAGRYPGLPKAKIARIYENHFKPENLYKFCHLKGREDKNRDKNITLSMVK